MATIASADGIVHYVRWAFRGGRFAGPVAACGAACLSRDLDEGMDGERTLTCLACMVPPPSTVVRSTDE